MSLAIIFETSKFGEKSIKYSPHLDSRVHIPSRGQHPLTTPYAVVNASLVLQYLSPLPPINASPFCCAKLFTQCSTSRHHPHPGIASVAISSSSTEYHLREDSISLIVYQHICWEMFNIVSRITINQVPVKHQKIFYTNVHAFDQDLFINITIINDWKLSFLN